MSESPLPCVNHGSLPSGITDGHVIILQSLLLLYYEDFLITLSVQPFLFNMMHLFAIWHSMYCGACTKVYC